MPMAPAICMHGTGGSLVTHPVSLLKFPHSLSVGLPLQGWLLLEVESSHCTSAISELPAAGQV